jgi:hypothetical protein
MFWRRSLVLFVVFAAFDFACLNCEAFVQQKKQDIGNWAPENCEFFFGWTGELKPDLEGNSTERWMAQPEIMDFVDELDRWAKVQVEKNGSDDPRDAIGQAFLASAPSIALTQPWALYMTEASIERPKLKFILKLEKHEEFARGLIARFESEYAADLRPVVDDEKFRAYRGSAMTDPAEYGIVDGHLLIASGEGEYSKLLADFRNSTKPKWYSEIEAELKVERLAGVMHWDVPKQVEKIKSDDDIPAELHLDEIGKVSSVLGVAGDDTIMRTSIHCAPNPQGVMGLLDSKPMELEDLGSVPDSVNILFAGRIAHERFWGMKDFVADNAKKDIESFTRNFAENTGIDFEDDVIGGVDGMMVSYQKISMFNPAGGAVAYIRLKDGTKTAEKVAKAIKKLNDTSEDFFVETEESKYGPLYSVLPVAIENQIAPTIYFLIHEDELYVGADPKAISSHLRKAGRTTGKILTTQRVSDLFDNDKNGGLGNPIGVHYLELESILQIAYAAIPALAGPSMTEAGFDMEALPPTNIVTNGIQPNVLAFYRTEKGYQVVERMTLPGVTTITPVMIGMLLPAIQQVRSAARKAQSMNNVRQLMLSNLNFEASHMRFPAAYSVDKNDKRLLSWRVHILPYLGEQELYEKFRLDEPWDSEHNKALIDEMPDTFKQPAIELDSGKTVYLGVAGKQGMFAAPEKSIGDQKNPLGVKIASVVDGTSKTVMIVEANKSQAVFWTEPKDFDFEEMEDILGALKGNWPGGEVITVRVDGSASREIYESNEEFRKLLTRNGYKEESDRK